MILVFLLEHCSHCVKSEPGAKLGPLLCGQTFRRKKWPACLGIPARGTDYWGRIVTVRLEQRVDSTCWLERGPVTSEVAGSSSLVPTTLSWNCSSGPHFCRGFDTLFLGVRSKYVEEDTHNVSQRHSEKRATYQRQGQAHIQALTDRGCHDGTQETARKACQQTCPQSVPPCSYHRTGAAGKC